MNNTKIYVWNLDKFKLQGRKNCKIFFVRHSENFEELSKEALKRNIIITSISKKEYIRIMRGNTK